MTTERWTDDMLDSLASHVSNLTTDIQALLNVAQIHQQNMEMVISRIDEMQSEVRGLQTENRRILDQFINREGD